MDKPLLHEVCMVLFTDLGLTRGKNLLALRN